MQFRLFYLRSGVDADRSSIRPALIRMGCEIKSIVLALVISSQVYRKLSLSYVPALGRTHTGLSLPWVQ